MTDPILARCRNTLDPCAFEVVCQSDAHRDTVEQHHLSSRHGAPEQTTDEVSDRIWTERGEDRAKVVQAIEAVAALNHGEVDWNTVRTLIDGEVAVGVPGAVVNVLQRQGRLRFVREVQSTDRKGRNSNKKAKVYALVSAHVGSAS